jgi:hypothetical protein
MKHAFDQRDENRFATLPLSVPGGEPASWEGYCVESSSASLHLCFSAVKSLLCYFQGNSL